MSPQTPTTLAPLLRQARGELESQAPPPLRRPPPPVRARLLPHPSGDVLAAHVIR